MEVIQVFLPHVYYSKDPSPHINYATTTLNHLTYYKTLPCIIKRIRCKNSGNKLSIREILEKNLIKIVKNSEIVKRGYELIDNEKVDIKELAVEVGKLFRMDATHILKRRKIT